MLDRFNIPTRTRRAIWRLEIPSPSTHRSGVLLRTAIKDPVQVSLRVPDGSCRPAPCVKYLLRGPVRWGSAPSADRETRPSRHKP